MKKKTAKKKLMKYKRCLVAARTAAGKVEIYEFPNKKVAQEVADEIRAMGCECIIGWL